MVKFNRFGLVKRKRTKANMEERPHERRGGGEEVEAEMGRGDYATQVAPGA